MRATQPDPSPSAAHLGEHGSSPGRPGVINVSTWAGFGRRKPPEDDITKNVLPVKVYWRGGMGWDSVGVGLYPSASVKSQGANRSEWMVEVAYLQLN